MYIILCTIFLKEKFLETHFFYLATLTCSMLVRINLLMLLSSMRNIFLNVFIFKFFQICRALKKKRDVSMRRKIIALWDVNDDLKKIVIEELNSRQAQVITQDFQIGNPLQPSVKNCISTSSS